VPVRLLFPLYFLVMGAAYACFLRAFAVRKNTPRHVRWAVTGLVLDVAGTLVVLLVHRVLGVAAHVHDADVVRWHRGFAYVTTAMLLFVAWSGWRRRPVHVRMWPVFLPLYGVTLALAVVGYWPFS
jgi:hypothetical protein